MTLEKDKVIEVVCITGKGCVPNQSFRVGDSAIKLLRGERNENQDTQMLTPVERFMLRIQKTIEIRESRQTSG